MMSKTSKLFLSFVLLTALEVVRYNIQYYSSSEEQSQVKQKADNNHFY